MTTLPEAALYDSEQIEPGTYVTKTFLIQDGRITRMGDGLEAMQQAVEIALDTERFRYQIYSSDFGAELNGLIGKPPEYVTSMVKRRAKEALAPDERILAAENFAFKIEWPGKLHCTFEVKTVYGRISSRVTI